MNYTINLYVREIPTIKRTIKANDNVPLSLLIRSLIISMNGNPTNLYLLEKDDEVLCFQDDDPLKTLHLKVGDTYEISYNYHNKAWTLTFVISEKNEGLIDPQINVISGAGYGIYEKEHMCYIERVIDEYNKDPENMLVDVSQSLQSYLSFQFTLSENQTLVNDYINLYETTHQPQNIVMNVSLKGFDKEIKRKIIVNNNILIDQFCRAIIVSMHGDLEHLYTIKINKQWYEEDILDEKLNYLDLSPRNKFTIIYDYGDNWEFNIKVGKISSGYRDKPVELIDGKGYGIVEDCGGIYLLGKVFNGEYEEFAKEDINDFNLQKLQKSINKQLKIANLHQERIDYY